MKNNQIKNVEPKIGQIWTEDNTGKLLIIDNMLTDEFNHISFGMKYKDSDGMGSRFRLGKNWLDGNSGYSLKK